MDVGSPDNGLNEINELLRNDGPCMSEELDLEFLMNKDVTNSYFYNDLVTDDKFQIDQQQQEPSLLSDLQYGGIAGTDCHDVDLGETNLIYNQDKLHFESQEDHCNGEDEGYIPNDFFKVESDSVQSQFENNFSSPMSQIVAEQDGILDKETPDISNSVCDVKSEKTPPLLREMTSSEPSDGETESILGEKKEKMHLQERSPEKYYDKRSADIDPSSRHARREKGGCSSKSSQDCLKGQSYSSGYDRRKPNSIGKSSSSLRKDATRCPVPCSEGWNLNPTSSRDSRKRPKMHAPSSPRDRQSYRGHRVSGRQRSATPARRRVGYSGYERDSRCISRSRSPRRRDNHLNLQRYSPRRRTPPPPRSTRHRSGHRSTPFSSPPRRRDFGSGQPPGRCLFVAGFCFRTTERDLERKFSRFGRVRDIRVIRNKRSGDSRGFGFLTLERDEDADAAIRTLHNTDWNGRVILVEKSNGPS